MEQIKLESADQAVDAIKSNSRVCPVGASTKSALQNLSSEHKLLDCRGLNGLLDYEPTEFTFTARSGTPLSEINQALEANSQYLPFDPPFVKQGATLGGAIASGLNGSSSLRYGSARDFVLGVRFVDGQGNHVFAGGKVVKNAAGFDLPKFMVGSYGRFGLLTELTLKVFPRPEEQETIFFEAELDAQMDLVKQLVLTPLEIDAIDSDPDQLVIRLGGSKETIESARNRILELFALKTSRRITGDQELEYWQNANQFSWFCAQSQVLLKVPCQINDVKTLSDVAKQFASSFRVSVAGQVMYMAVEHEKLEDASKSIRNAGANSVAICGRTSNNPIPQGGLWTAVEKALDPDGRFGTSGKVSG